jgi:hypothetical protein
MVGRSDGGSLCAASAWAANYTLVTSMEEFGAGNYVITGEKTDGGEAAMLNVVDTGSFLKSSDVTVANGVISDPDSSIVWEVAATEEGWTIYNKDAGGYVKFPGGTKNKATTELTVTDDSTWAISFDDGVATVDNVGTSGRKLQYNQSTPRFACYTSAQTPLKFYKEGDGTFSVEVEPSIDFRLEAAEWALTEGNQGAYLTAVPKNGVGDIRYEWTGSFEGTNETLRIPDSLVAGIDTPTVYSVTVTATDSADPEPRRTMADFSFTLTRAPGLFTVAVDDGIENGTVQLFAVDGETETELMSGESVYEGTTVKVVATPADRSFKVESVGVAATDEPSNTVSLENGEFTMPGFDVTVTATFTKWEGTVYALVESMDDFEAGADYLIVAGTDAMMNATNGERIAVSEVEITDDVVATEDESIVWRIAAGTSEGKYTISNAAAQVCVSASTVAGMKEGRLVEDGTGDAAQWTIDIAEEDPLATIGSIHEGESLMRNEKNHYFATYKGGVKPYLFKKVGAGVFSISLDPSGEDVVFTEGEGGTITASAKNAQGAVTYTWNWTEEGPGSASEDGSQWVIPADAPTGSWTLYCSATDEMGNEADASVSFSILKVYEVTIDGDIVGGSVVAEPMSGVAGTPVTVTATAEAGYKCESILVNGEAFAGPTYTFELPEGGATVSATFAESTGESFTLLSDADGLQDGTRVVLTDPDGAFALPALVTGSVFAVTAVAPVNDAITTEDASIVWTLVDDGNGKFSLYNEAAKKYAGHAGGGSSNSGRLQDSPFPHAISASEGLFAIAATAADGAGNYRSLQYNPNVQQGVANPRFAYYKGGQKNLRVYAAGVAPAAFSITLNHAEDFTVVEGEAFSIEAEPKNNVGAVTYVWTVDGVLSETHDAMLSLTAGEASETAHEVVCTATDTGAEEGAEPAVASVKYTVVSAPTTYTVTVADGIENGEVKLFDGETELASGAEVPESTVVTVVAEPADGFELEAITVNGNSIEGTTFTVAGDAVVSATFIAVKDYATLPFLAEDTPFTGPWQNPKAAGVTAYGLDTDYNSSDGRGAKFDTTGDWLQVKFEGMPGEMSYALKGNNTSADSVSTFDVLESETGEDGTWTAVMTHRSDINLHNNTKTNFTSELKPVSRFVKFVYTEKAQGNVGLYDVYIERGGFSVSLSVKDGAEFEQGETVVAKATPKHHNGDEVTYSWTLDGVAASADGDEVALDTGVLGPHELVCRATQHMALGETAEAEASATYTVVEARPRFTVSIAEGIENGSVAILVDGEEVATPAELPEGTEVTVVATPAGGYKTEAITVNGDAITGDTFTVTEDAEVSAMFVDRGNEFVKITGLDGLEEGEYVITGAGTRGEYAMKAELSETSTVFIKRQEEPVEIENDAIAGPDASIVWTVEKVDEGWTIYNEAIGYVGYVARDNSAGAEEEASAKSTWTVSEASGELFLLTNVGNTGRMLLYNASAPRFACYTKTSSGKALAFYKKAGPAEFTVSVDETGFVLKQGEGRTVTATAKNGNGEITYSWSSGTVELNRSGRELAIPGTLEPGAYSATVTATDSSDPKQMADAELTFTVVATYPVTVAEAIENGSVSVDKAIAAAGETVTVTATPVDGYKLLSIRVNGQPIEGDTFEMPEGPAEVSAVFAKIALYPIIIDGNIEHGEIGTDKDEAEPGETVTLTAEAEDGWKLDTFLLNGEPIGGNSFAMPEGEAQVSAVFVQRAMVTYVPVQRADDFVAGEEYLLVAVKEGAYTSAMKNAANGSRIGVDEVEIAGDGSISTDNEAILWTIGTGAGDGQFTLFNSAAGVYAAGPDAAGNNAQLVADGTSSLAQWTLDLSEAPLAKIGSVAYAGRYLQRNADKGNPYFATYAPGQTTPTLFKKAGPPPFQVTIDAEDGFILAEGTSRALRAEAENGVEPYGYVWSSETAVELIGTGPTLDIPATLEASDEPYSVTVTASDATEAEVKATISFFVKPLYSVTIDPGITGGTVTADKESAFEGDTVTLTVEAAPNHRLVAVFVNDDELTGTSFPMPASDVVVSATFAEVVDYATLPFIDEETPYSGPWKNAVIPGLTNEGLDSDYDTGGVYGAKFRTTGAWMQIKFQGTPGTLSFGIKGNGVSETNVSTFVVQESADGETWTPVAVFTSDDNLTGSRQDVSYTLSEDSRYVQFLYQEKGDGNVGIYDVYIGEAGEAQPTVTVTGETTLTLDGTFALELGLENYSGEFTWAWAPSTVGYVDADTATFWWTPARTGETEVTFSAMDGDRTIASETVTLTVFGKPALVFGGDDEGTVGTPVNFTVEAVNVADPTVAFMGFLDVPDGSALTDADVIIDFPNVTFTPDVAGEYGLSFSAGTVGVDYVEDTWIVTVAAAPAVTLVDGETTVQKGDYFLLQFALENYTGAFAWAADVGEIDEDGYFTWTPTKTGDFPVVVSAVAGDETIASATVTLTVTSGGEPGGEIQELSVDSTSGTLSFKEPSGIYTVESTKDLVNGPWEPITVPVEDGRVIIPMEDGPRYYRVAQ